MLHRCAASESEMDDTSSDDEEWTSKTMAMMRSVQNNLFATALVVSKYYLTYHDKNDARICGQSGYGWLMETLNTPGESHKMFRMNASLFYSLHELLVSTYGLQSSIHMNSMEALAIFLIAYGHGWSNSALHNIFKHSGETISRKIGEVLNCVVAMCEDYIRPPHNSRPHQF